MMARARVLSGVLVFFLVVGLTACGGGGAATGPSVNVSGTYEGTEQLVTGTQNVRITIDQNGSTVTGSYVSSSGYFGRIEATVTGTRIEGHIMATRDHNICDFSGDIADGGARITGTFRCPGQAATSFSVTRV